MHTTLRPGPSTRSSTHSLTRPDQSSPSLTPTTRGKTAGLVAGAYWELHGAFHITADLIASQLADGHLQFFDTDHGPCKSIFLQQARKSPGLAQVDRCGVEHKIDGDALSVTKDLGMGRAFEVELWELVGKPGIEAKT